MDKKMNIASSTSSSSGEESEPKDPMAECSKMLLSE